MSQNQTDTKSPKREHEEVKQADPQSDPPAEPPEAKRLKSENLSMPEISVAEKPVDAAVHETKKNTSDRPKPNTPRKVLGVQITTLGSETRKSEIKQQIEYYMSVDNLKYDKFFHEELSKDPNNELKLELLVSCPKLKNAQVTLAELKAALDDSSFEIREHKNEGNDVEFWLKRSEPIPPLQSKPSKNTKTLPDVHRGGCFLKITNIPEETQWPDVKKALQASLGEKGKVGFMSAVSDLCECLVYIKPFQNDKEELQKLKCEIEGAKLTCSLAEDAEARSFANTLPRQTKKAREKAMNRARQIAAKKPISLAGTNFKNLDHLRQCVRELLDKTEAGTILGAQSAGHKVLSELIKYHPRCEQKMQGFESFKVGLFDKQENEQSNVNEKTKKDKCFFVVRKSGESEDFSIVKCVQELARRGTDALKADADT